jgi:ATP synthase protein I
MTLAFRLSAVQAAVTLAGAGLALGIAGPAAAGAALYGGAAAVLPALVFGWRITRRKEDTLQSALGAVYRGELVKIALSVVLLGAGAVVFGAQFLPLILTFSACLLAYGVALAAGW